MTTGSVGFLLDTSNIQSGQARAGTPARVLSLASTLALAGTRVMLIVCDRGRITGTERWPFGTVLLDPHDYYASDLSVLERSLKEANVRTLVSCEAETTLRVHRLCAEEGLQLIYDVHDDDEKVSASLGAHNAERRSRREVQDRALRAASQIWVSSPHEWRMAQRTVGNATIVSFIHNGCRGDLGYGKEVDFSSRVSVFVGNMDYPPNRAAADFLVDLVRADVGSAATGRIRLVGQGYRDPLIPNVEVAGFVSSYRVAIRGAALGVAPLLAGAGAKMKVRDYCSAGLPVLTTTEGAAGLPPSEGIVIEDRPHAWGAEISRLIGDPARLRAMSELTTMIARGPLNWDEIGESMRASLNQFVIPPERGDSNGAISTVPRWVSDNARSLSEGGRAMTSAGVPYMIPAWVE